MPTEVILNLAGFFIVGETLCNGAIARLMTDSLSLGETVQELINYQ